MIDRIAISGYRSIRSIILRLGQLNLYQALRLIADAAENSQVIVVSHNAALVDELEADEICVPIQLEKSAGETVLCDADLLSQYGWKWPKR
ncbi:MAG: hypothetical protein WBD31_29755 [Rubripirellula sp.]